MAHSSDDIRELCVEADRLLVGGERYGITSLEDLQGRLRRKSGFEKINFQDKCEGNNSLGDLLLKYATEEGYSLVEDFLLENGCNLPQPEQVTAEVNEEGESDIVENEEAGSINFINHSMTAEMRYEQLRQGKETNHAIFDSFANAVRGSNIAGDRGVFLDVVKLFTNLDAVIHLKDTASRTILDIAAITKQADVVKVLLVSGKFSEEEKLCALNHAIVQGNVQEVREFLGYVSARSRQEALGMAMHRKQEEITQVILNFIAPETPNHDNGIPVINQTTTPNFDNQANGFRNPQFSLYKESKENFYTSLRNDAVGVVITGLFIAAAVMVPSVAGAVVCGIVAALVAIGTGLHIKNSTLPSYREMEANRVECISQGLLILAYR